MQRELEIHAEIVTELRRLLSEAREQLADTQEKLERVEARGRTRERRLRRRIARAAAAHAAAAAAVAEPAPVAQQPVVVDPVASLNLSEAQLYLRYFGYSEEYIACGSRDLEWMTVLYSRLQTHTRLLRGLPDPLQAAREVGWLQRACDSDLSVQMWALSPYELLPVPPYPLNPEEADPAVVRDYELNALKHSGEMVGRTDLWREFLIRWRHYHKRLPNQYAVEESMRLNRWS